MHSWIDELQFKDNQKHIIAREINATPILTFSALDASKLVRAGFSTRLGGVSKGAFNSMNLSYARGDDEASVRENFSRIAKALGVADQHMVFLKQVHSTKVIAIDETEAKDIFAQQNMNTVALAEGDGMITNIPAICLVTFYADCVPLYFLDPVHKAIGLSHAGWRGTVDNIAAVTVKKMQEAYGTRPEELIVCIGPSICADCYEVSEDVITQFRLAFPKKEWPLLFREVELSVQASQQKDTPIGKFYLDLWAANTLHLIATGVQHGNIHCANLCTKCNPDVLFSHRVMGNQRGSLAAFMSLNKEVVE